MRKSGGFSLFVYLFYLVCGLGLGIYFYIAAQNAEGWDGLGYALLLVVCAVAAGVGLLGLLLKLIHVGTGWGFFGFLCMLVDLAVIAYIAYVCYDGGLNSSAIVLFGLPIIFSVGSFISNIKSLGR